LVSADVSHGRHARAEICFRPTTLTCPADILSRSHERGICVVSEEVFGPVLSVMTFRVAEAMFERANKIPHSLSADAPKDLHCF
jgi:acyl-CoA reductase-like NAD-dependent aldehyde dehydrogenase